MTQFTVYVEDKAILPHLKKILGAINGVSISKPKREKSTGIEEAMEDIKSGRVHTASGVQDMFRQILG